MNSNNCPSVVFIQNTEESIGKFISFFYKAPVFTQEILRLHPDLSGVEKKPREDGERILKEYATKYFETNLNSISDFLRTTEIGFRAKGEEALVSMTKIMQYTWPENMKQFTVYPGIRGGTNFDPKNNTLYLSIFTPADTDREKEKLGMTRTSVIIHEICHIVFRDIASRLNVEVKSSDVMHLVQEVLAPVIMNQPTIKESLGIENYWGNPYLKPILFDTGKVTLNMVEYADSLFKKMTDEKKTFMEYVARLVSIFTSVQPELEEKMKIWNNEGKKILKDPVIMDRYAKPIRISE